MNDSEKLVEVIDLHAQNPVIKSSLRACYDALNWALSTQFYLARASRKRLKCNHICGTCWTIMLILWGIKTALPFAVLGQFEPLVQYFAEIPRYQ